jgi:hypothetical protein
MASWLSKLFAWLRPADPAPAQEAPSPRAPIPFPVSIDEARIPTAAREKVAQIKALLTDLEGRCAGGAGAGEFDELRRISTVHLPRLIQSYVEIPPEYRAEVFRETGRSASYILAEQLDKLLGRLREISRMLAQGDVDAFNQNVRFIDMQYGSSFPGVDA